jgi:hypothetical protein
MQTLESYIDEVWADCWEMAEEPTAEIFGNAEEFPDDEMELVFSSAFGKLTQAAKMQALAELRAKKGIRCN